MNDFLCFTGASIVTPFRLIPDGVLVLNGPVIDRIGRRNAVPLPDGAREIHLPGRFILPGFADLHLHGLAGHDFDHVDDAGLEQAAQALLAHGATCALITLMLPPPAQAFPVIERVVRYLNRADRSPVFCGLHAEGPFLNPEIPGAIAPDHLWPADSALAERLFEACGPWLKLMTIAPEMPGALDIIRNAVRRGVVPSIGHSKAKYEQVEDAIDCGLAQVTHMFNAMLPAHHRDPGVLGAAYTHQELKVQLIADGVHVHPVILKFVAKVRGAGGVLLISDASPFSAMPDGDYPFLGRSVRVAGGMVTLPNGTIAGSAQLLDAGVRTMVQKCGVAIGDVARMAGLNPLRVLNLDHRKGILTASHDADLVILGPDLVPEMTVLGGRIVYQKS